MSLRLLSGLCLFVCTSVAAAPVPRASVDAGTIYGGAIGDHDWGRPVASGDLDNDGYDEIIVAASESFGNVYSYVYIMRGGPDAHRRGAVDLSAGGVDQVIVGATLNDNLGASIATGDVNGDGIDDLLVCASTDDYGSTVDAGIAYLIYGGPTFFASSMRDLAVVGAWDVRFAGPVVGGDMGGMNAFGGLDAHGAAIGNLNGDQYGDIVLGVHLATGGASGSGRVYVRFGSAFFSGITYSLALTSSYNVRIDGADDGDDLGAYVLTGDITGDGIDELIIPNQWASQGLFTTEGAVHIFRGGASWPTYVNLATTAAPITLWGAREYDYLGSAAAVGDFNGDGIGDLASAASGADEGAWTNQRGDGIVYGLFGSTTYQTGTHVIDYATATPGFRLIGEFEENLGSELAAGDFNLDGYDDIAAGQRFAGPNINGSVDVLFGRAFAGNPTYHAAVDTNLRIVGADGDRISFSMGAPDVNGDGRTEIVYGTPFNNGVYPDEKGTVYVLTYLEGDFDADLDRDLGDYAALQKCFAGAPPFDDTCYCFDQDLDGDIDLADYAAFAANLAGPG